MAAPVLQNAPFMINRMVQSAPILPPKEEKLSDEIKFKTGNQMQLPAVDFLSSIAPQFNQKSFFAKSHDVPRGGLKMEQPDVSLKFSD